jgi:hypothetical protein
MGTKPMLNDEHEITDTMVVRHQKIPVVIKFLPQAKLRFFPENPRIYSIVRADGKEPTQEEILKRLLDLEHVKELVQDIKRNGGLIESLLVRDNTFEVLEGNSRLAAYRFLAKADPITWSMVKCTVLPTTVDEPLIFAILGQHHIKGKKDWAPYEQAGFVYRRFKTHKVDLDTLAREIGLSQKKIKHLVDTYQFMLDHNENDVNRWSYYDEYLKSSKIRKAREKFSQLDDLVVKKINSEEIERAVQIRDELPLICTGPAKNLKRFAEGKESFADAYEAAQEAGGDNNHLKRLARFRHWLVKPEAEKAFNRATGQTRLRIGYELDKLFARIQALRKVLQQSEK